MLKKLLLPIVTISILVVISVLVYSQMGKYKIGGSDSSKSSSSSASREVRLVGGREVKLYNGFSLIERLEGGAQTTFGAGFFQSKKGQWFAVGFAKFINEGGKKYLTFYNHAGNDTLPVVRVLFDSSESVPVGHVPGDFLDINALPPTKSKNLGSLGREIENYKVLVLIDSADPGTSQLKNRQGVVVKPKEIFYAP